MPWKDDRAQTLDCGFDNGKTVCISFEAGTFHEGSPGDIEARFRTDKTPAFPDRIEQMRAG